MWACTSLGVIKDNLCWQERGKYFRGKYLKGWCLFLSRKISFPKWWKLELAKQRVDSSLCRALLTSGKGNRFINFSNLTSKLDPFALCHNDNFLSLFYRHHLVFIIWERVACVFLSLARQRNTGKACALRRNYGPWQFKGKPFSYLFLSLHLQSLEPLTLTFLS